MSPDRPDEAPDEAPDEGGDTSPPAPPTGTADASGPGSTAPQHHDDGLDLARALTRAAARSTPIQRKKGRKRDLRPTRGRVSGAHPDERDPQLLDTTVGRLVDDHGWAVDLRVHGVFGRWAELVGAEVAQHCTPESFAEGKLLVRTDSTAWATQLRLLAPTVVRRLNEELGHGTVVLIEVAGPHLPNWKKGPRSVRDGRGPRDTYG